MTKSAKNTLVDSFSNSSGVELPHLIIEARAGSGKTTTLVEGLKLIQGSETPFEPSPMQAAIWDAMRFEEGGRAENPSTIAFVAFNKSIATELQERVPSGVSAMTMHSMGNRAVAKSYGRKQPTSWVTSDLVSEIMEMDSREIRKRRPDLLRNTDRLVSLVKMNLVGYDRETGVFDPGMITATELDKLASHYDIELNGDANDIYNLVPEVLELFMERVEETSKMSFDDMIWVPVVMDLPVYRYDLLLVDEAQDLNPCQQELALKASKRMILCGDPKQAIYGFAGADSRSMGNMFDRLSETERGCITLPLNETRRCGKAIVEEAQKIVPDFYAHESNSEGAIERVNYLEEGWTQQVEGKDMILSRVNAPLVQLCFRFIAEGRRADIRGRDIGQGLISTVKKMKTEDIYVLQDRLDDWYYSEVEKQQRKKYNSEARLIALQDRYNCLNCFIEGSTSVAEVISRIEDLFSDDRSEGIQLSSIHKAKGLEADRVWLLRNVEAPIPHPMAKSATAKEQEMNLLYVGITRAISTLVFVE